MENLATNLISQELVSEPEIVDLIQTTEKLVKLEVLTSEDLDYICEILGVKQIEKNVFELNENSIYTFN